MNYCTRYNTATSIDVVALGHESCFDLKDKKTFWHRGVLYQFVRQYFPQSKNNRKISPALQGKAGFEPTLQPSLCNILV